MGHVSTALASLAAVSQLDVPDKEQVTEHMRTLPGAPDPLLVTFFAFTFHGHFTQPCQWPDLAMMSPPLYQMGITLEKAL